MRLLIVALVLLACPAVAYHGGDHEPPVFHSVTVSTHDAVPGDTIEVRFRVTDESGIVDGHANVRAPEEAFHWSSYDCDDPGGAQDVTMVCRLTIRDTAPAGSYVVWAVQATDGVGHVQDHRIGHEFEEDADHDVRFTVHADHDDLEGPALEEVRPDSSAQAGGSIPVHVRATDEVGIDHVSIRIEHADGSPSNLVRCEGEQRTAWDDVCAVPIPDDFPRGTYHVDNVLVMDLNGAFTSLGQEELQARGFETAFTVGGDHTDTEAPRLLSVQAPVHPVQRGSEFQVLVWARDASGVASVGLTFGNEVGTTWATNQLVTPRDRCTPWVDEWTPVVCTGTVPVEFPLGEQRLHWGWLEDEVGNAEPYKSPLMVKHGATPADGPRNRTSFWVGPRALAEHPEVRVEPGVVETLPGRVVPIVFNLTNHPEAPGEVDVRLSGPDGTLAAVGCVTDFRTDATGFSCEILVPPGVSGTFSLDEVVLRGDDGNTTLRVDAGPSLHVAADGVETTLPTLPEDWEAHYRDGVTLSSFNGGTGSRPAPLRVEGGSDGPGGARTLGGEDTVDPSPGLDVPAPSMVAVLLSSLLVGAVLRARRTR